MITAPEASAPFADFAPPIAPVTDLRRAITAAYRRPEPDCVAALIDEASVTAEQAARIADTTRALVSRLRAKGQRGGVEGLVKEYSLSSQEGVALMCLAEALLRIPDNDTRDALIRDKIAEGDWQSHVGDGKSLFVNAATWGLMVTGKLVGSGNDTGLSAALTRLIARAGEPVIRRGVDMAMAMMGEQFVTGETIGEALKRSRKLEAEGFGYSYDMLGEAATTAADAARYYADYEAAIRAIGKASAGRSVYHGPGISIKLSALHPRYARAQAARVMDELLPRVQALAVLARSFDIGFNIDAEEADRLELSLDLLERLAFDPALSDWSGLGFVVQGYGKRCPFVIDWLVDLARRSERRIMVRLVKGAYWDSEIKRAQVDGQVDFPVYTRKVHTDVAYVACARKLLAHRDVLFPQFATHNAQTLATIYELAGPDFAVGDWEFQCLHGMGEPLYEEVVGAAKLNRPCRIYAPVGTHETLLAYLVRRLLENGANSSFVHRIWDEGVSIDDLTADPAVEARRIVPLGAPHPIVLLPRAIYGARVNSAGLDLSNEATLADLDVALRDSATHAWRAAPTHGTGAERAIINPADRDDVVGRVVEADAATVAAALDRAAAAAPRWAAVPVTERAAMLERAADAMQAAMPTLIGLTVREAGKSVPNAIAEVREAIDFLRYYAEQARGGMVNAAPLGPVTCISPWNFPLAIFTGQVVAALVAGNPVLAKPAEETPLIAAEGVRLLHAAGVPDDVLQILPGDGGVGAAMVASPRTMGVLFTGSTEVAKLIQAELAGRVGATGAPVPLIAETGGQNAMIVDSSALAEQVVADVIASAFDSAGQRCSALRILCLQDDIADRQLAMLRGALAELNVGNPDRLATDIGPVISEDARTTIEEHVVRMRELGCAVERVTLDPATDNGTFVAPTIVEIASIDQLRREVFGPVLHVLRFDRDDLERVVDAVNATGYGLTFGLHTRIDDTVEAVTARAAAGNVYVNRNVIGAVVGVQPFGGRGLSGTGPKAGGPLYLPRLATQCAPRLSGPTVDDPALDALARWLADRGQGDRARRAFAARIGGGQGSVRELAGPVGERNLYALHPRGRVLAVPFTADGLADQLIAVLATGNDPVVVADGAMAEVTASLPDAVRARTTVVERIDAAGAVAAALVEPGGAMAATLAEIARLDGPIPLTQVADAAGEYRLDWLLEEVSTSINTTAAGGNASLMALV